MKLAQKFTEHLAQHFQKAEVLDQRGDGHFLQMIAVDPVFAGQKPLQRSRIIFKALGDLKARVHAYSVKGFTPEEWAEMGGKYAVIEYRHLH